MRDAYLIGVASAALAVQMFRTWLAWVEYRERHRASAVSDGNGGDEP